MNSKYEAWQAWQGHSHLLQSQLCLSSFQETYRSTYQESDALLEGKNHSTDRLTDADLFVNKSKHEQIPTEDLLVAGI